MWFLVRMEIRDLPLCRPEQGIPGDPVQTTAADDSRPDETPKPCDAGEKRPQSQPGTGHSLVWIGSGKREMVWMRGVQHTLHGSGHGVRTPDVLPEDELAAGLEEPVYVADVVFEVVEGTLSTVNTTASA